MWSNDILSELDHTDTLRLLPWCSLVSICVHVCVCLCMCVCVCSAIRTCAYDRCVKWKAVSEPNLMHQVWRSPSLRADYKLVSCKSIFLSLCNWHVIIATPQNPVKSGHLVCKSRGLCTRSSPVCDPVEASWCLRLTSGLQFNIINAHQHPETHFSFSLN